MRSNLDTLESFYRNGFKIDKKYEKHLLTEECVNIYAAKGYKVRTTKFTLSNQYHKTYADKLVLNTIYTVEKTHVGSSSTDVYIQEIPNIPFPSVLFVEVKPQEYKITKQHPDYEKWNH